MAQSRITIAKPDIVRLFEERGPAVYRRRELSELLAANRAFWRLAESETVAGFIEFLLKRTKLQRVLFDFPSRRETRYTWGDVPFYDVVLSAKPDAYFSHYTAMYFHELTEQIPKTIYLNCEQRPKPAPAGELVQERIDGAFRRPMRVTSNVTEFQGYRVCLLSGKHTDQLGVVSMNGPDDASVRVTSLERTLIDVAVRPAYAGGVHEVLRAFRLAASSVSVNRMAAFLKKLAYVYPYHQVLGFYLDRAGNYEVSRVRLFRKDAFEFDFYLAHDMGDTDYDAEWRLFIPKGF